MNTTEQRSVLPQQAWLGAPPAPPTSVAAEKSAATPRNENTSKESAQ